LAGSIVGARTLAIEPIPSTYTRLVANLKLNCIESLSQTKCVGLGSSSGFLNMTRSLDPRNQIIFDENTNQSIQVKVETLDFVALGLSPTLIKIDVEGWELEVIRGGFNTLRNPSLVALIVELNESGERYGFLDCDIFEALKNFGFHPYTYDAFSRTVQKISGKNPDSGNTIFIRNVEEVARKIGTAPRREILGNWI
jgi:FkbM family methyltransferase